MNADELISKAIKSLMAINAYMSELEEENAQLREQLETNKKPVVDEQYPTLRGGKDE